MAFCSTTSRLIGEWSENIGSIAIACRVGILMAHSAFKITLSIVLYTCPFVHVKFLPPVCNSVRLQSVISSLKFLVSAACTKLPIGLSFCDNIALKSPIISYGFLMFLCSCFKPVHRYVLALIVCKPYTVVKWNITPTMLHVHFPMNILFIFIQLSESYFIRIPNTPDSSPHIYECVRTSFPAWQDLIHNTISSFWINSMFTDSYKLNVILPDK